MSSIELFWSELFVNHQRIDAALMGFWGRPAAAKQMQLDVSRTGPLEPGCRMGASALPDFGRYVHLISIGGGG